MGGNYSKKEKKDNNNKNVKLKQKKRRKGKKEKQSEQSGNVVDTTAAAVVKLGTAPPTPATTPTLKGYCFWCGEEGHSAKQCQHISNLTCPLHPGSVRHMQKACSNWGTMQNLGVYPTMLKHEANQVVVDTPEAVFGTSLDNSAEVLSNFDTTSFPNGGNASLNGCHLSIKLG